MNQIAKTSPQLQEFLAAPASPQVPKANFATHGIWGMGVRLMRNMSFASKALLITFAFCVPIGLLIHAVAGDYFEKLAFAKTEIEGVQQLRAYSPINHQLLTARSAARAMAGGFDAMSVYKASRSEGDTQFANFEQSLAKSADPLQIRSEFDALKKSWAATANSSNGMDASGARSVYGPVTEASVLLFQKISDKSGLILDPDVDALYLVLASVQSLPVMAENFGQVRSWSVFLAAKGDKLSPADRQRDQLRYAVWDAELRASMKSYREYIEKAVAYNPALKSRLDIGFLEKAEAYRAKAYTASMSGDKADAADLWTSGAASFDEIGQAGTKLLPVLEELLHTRIANLDKEHFTIAAVVVIALFMAGYFFYSFYLVTRGGLRLISRHLQEMAEGDLRTAPYRPWGKDEPALVIMDLRKTYDALHMLIRRVRHSARALHAASGEISAASNDLSARTESAAASLEQQASAMEEIGSTVGGTAERAQGAAKFALDNAHVAEKGGQVFNQVVTTMREIHASSSQIGDIISVIDGIAFQTNILALNAAVEAARAGEQGRGFAVVATEVRTLAQRSAAAAREIKTLINASVERAESGSRVVEEAGQAMTAVVNNAKKINDYLEEISISSRQQAIGVTEVGKAIQELDRNTQQNAALVEQTSAAAGALAQQADALQGEIANFRVV